MKLIIPKGATSRIITVYIANINTGEGLASLNSSSGIVGGYVREGGTGVALAVDETVAAPGTYQAPSTAAHVRIGTPANMRAGTYELHFHNSLWATGAETVTITLGGATNMKDIGIEAQLDLTGTTVGTLAAIANGAITTASIADGAITDAKITVPTVSGVATGVLGMIVQTWRRFFKKATKTSTELKTYADNGSTVLTTQTVTEGATEEQGAAS